MSKMEEALILNPPSELHFKGSFTDVITSYINLTNTTERDICFKVRTTAPKAYCVRPNYGTIAPKTTISIAMMLQPLDLKKENYNNHKFLVQSIFAPEGECNFEDLWNDAHSNNFKNSKLTCVIDIPDEPSQDHDAEITLRKLQITNERLQSELNELHQENSALKAHDVYAKTILQKLQTTNERLQSELNELHQKNSALKAEGLGSRGTSTETELHQIPAKQHLAIINFRIALAIVSCL